MGSVLGLTWEAEMLTLARESLVGETQTRNGAHLHQRSEQHPVHEQNSVKTVRCSATGPHSTETCGTSEPHN
uniref:Uncharacterized protein n=1 Tax=Caenorhabditis japonica TaxID=281687 RepID=A0A8R1EGL3_CAEJA